MPTPLTDADKVLRNDTGKDIVEKLDDIAQALGVGVNADQINYDNTESGLEAENVQNAIDELNDNKADKTDLDTTTSITTPASVQTFSDGGDNIPMKSLVTEIVAIQSGSGVPSPSNVRAISGHNSVKVFNSGKNLIFTLYQSSSNLILINGESTYATTLKKGTYTFSATISKACSFNYRKSADDTTVNIKSFTTTGNVSATFTIDEDLYNCNFFLYSSQGVSVSDISNAQLELNDEATAYEAYKGSNITIPLDSTIYGGSLECVKGEGQITKIYIEFDGSSDEFWTMTSSGVFYCTPVFADGVTTDEKISNLYPFGGMVTSSSGVVDDKTFYGQKISTYNRLWVKDSTYSTVEDFKTFLSNNPLQIVYELATPTSLSIEGANIPTLSGVNNVYTDCGDIQSLEYYNNKTDELANLIRLMTRS